MISGGDMFISLAHNIQIKNTNITKSWAKKGSFILAEDLTNANALFQNIQITNIENSVISQSSVAVLNFGSLQILNSRFQDISSSLFEFNRMFVKLDEVTITGMTCESNEACLIKGSSLDLKLSNSEISDIISNGHLMTFSFSPKIWMQNLHLFDTEKSDTQGSIQKLYAFYGTNVQNIIIEGSDFRRLGFSHLYAKQSDVTIIQSIFSNQRRERFLAPLSIESITDFVYLDESNSLLKNSSFFGHDGLENEIKRSVNFFLKIICKRYLGNYNQWSKWYS